MSVIGLILILILLGGLAWAAFKLPIPPLFKNIIYFVLVVIAIFVSLSAFGVWDEVRTMKVPRV